MNDAQANLEALALNRYPGRGIVMGRNPDGRLVLQVYWVMGRSDNSRNRLLVREADTVKTVPHDMSKVEDPSLIIYNAMRVVRAQDGADYHVVSSGDHTDTIAEYLARGDTIASAVRSRSYEPDVPNFTSRISGIINTKNWTATSCITRRDSGSGEPQHDFYENTLCDKGFGLCLHTYQQDGDPLPPFQGAPYLVPLAESAEATARMYWDKLNPENRVAIVVKSINPQTTETECYIINQLAE